MPEEKDALTVGPAAVYPDSKPGPLGGLPLPSPPEPPPASRGVNLLELFEAVQRLKDERTQTIRDRAQFKIDMLQHVNESVKGALKDVRVAVEQMQADFAALRTDLGKKLNANFAARLANAEDRLDSMRRRLEQAETYAGSAVDDAKAALKANGVLTKRQNVVDDEVKFLRGKLEANEKAHDDKLRVFKKELVEAVDELVAEARKGGRRH